MRKIWRYLVFLIILLLILIAIFSHGVNIENIEASGVKIEQLYIKLDKKIILHIKNIQIPKQSSKDSSNDYLLSLTQNIGWLDKIFSEIYLEKISFENSEISLFFNRNSFHLNSPYLSLDAIINSSQNGIVVDINNLKFKDFNITLNGKADVNIKDKIYIFKGDFNSFELSGIAKLKLEKELLTYELSDINASSLKNFINTLSTKAKLNNEVKNWIFGYIVAQNYYLKILQGKINIATENFFLNEIYAKANAENLKVKFHQNLTPADVKKANIELINGNLNFELLEPKWQNKDLTGSNLYIYKIFEDNDAGLNLNLKINSLYDKTVNSILKAYDINVPVEQISGKTNGVLGLDIKFNPISITTRGRFITTGGHTIVAGADFEIGDAQIDLQQNRLNIEAKNSGMNFFKGDVDINIDLNSQTGDINGTAKDFNLSFGDKEILTFKNMPLNAKLDFSKNYTQMQIFKPNIALKFGNENEIKIHNINPLIKDSPLLSSIGIKGADFTLKTKNFKDLFIVADDVKFNIPLINKDGSKYESDSFLINIKNSDVIGKSQSEKLKFNVKNSKVKLDINGLDLELDADSNISNKGNFELDAINSNLIIKDLNSSIMLLKYHADSIKDTLIFDAKPTKGSFTLKKSKNKFEIFANDINGEFINSIFNIQSFSGGDFKMKILGTNAKEFKGEARLINATLKDFTFYHQLLTFINSVPSLLTFKTPDFDTNGYPVKFGKILFERKGDNLEILAAQLESSSADIIGHGNINLTTKSIDIDLELKLLKDASLIIDKIPIVNQVILGKNRSLSTVIKVRGTLDKPEYSTQILTDALLSPLKIIRNILQAPFLIFE